MTRIAFILALSLVPLASVAKPLTPASSQGKGVAAKAAGPNVANQLPAKKKVKPKTTRIDFAESDGVVIAPRNSALNKAINQADSQQRLQEVQIQTRTFVPAPPGDQSETLVPLTSPQEPSRAIPPSAPQGTSAPNFASNETLNSNLVTTETLVVPSKANAFPQPILINIEGEAPTEEDPSIRESVSDLSPGPIESKTASNDTKPVISLSTAQRSPFKSMSFVFLRSGYLHARYKEFDSRMKDGATSMGLGAARSFETEWGELEARASLDVYHAIDQSVSVDNVRMFTTRTEVAYWLNKSRVRPALTLGLGWADYAVKSYRSMKIEAGDEIVTMRTHAKSQGFTVIPGTALRIQLNDEIVIDAQTEFLGILGGDSATAVQGLAFGISLGWNL